MEQSFYKIANALANQPAALRELAKVKEITARAIETLQSCQKQVGMVTGEEVGSLLAEMTNTHFNGKEYNYERLPEGQ